MNFHQWILLIVLTIIINGNIAICQENKWNAPLWTDTLKNPYPNAVQEGKTIYIKTCAMCHGEGGKGDGISGRWLKPLPTNLTKEDFQGQSDGVIYWKITTGRSPMPSYEMILSEEQRWKLIAFIRQLGKNR